ncbi:MAG: AI-2E family transporter [Bacteroidetes bacterium]|nr:AI-2E family transporter [Bacteroidota bacterium]
MEIKNNGYSVQSPIIIIAALIIIFAGVLFAKAIINPFLIALFVSIICAQPISFLQKKKFPKWLALLIVILSLILLFSGFTFLIGGTLSSFSGNVSKYTTALKTISNTFIQYLNANGIKIPQDQMLTVFQPEKILEFTALAMNELISMLGNTFLVFLILLFILMEFGSFNVKAKAIMTGNESISYISTIIQNIRHYLWIKTMLCLLTGILVYIAFVIIGVDYPLLWALIVALLNYIPNIGSIIAAIPVVLFALVQLGTGGALWTLGSIMLVNNVLGNFIEPRIMGRGLGLSTMVVFLSLLFWGFILGTVGMFLSVPITMTIKIILEQKEKTRWIAILLGTPAEAKIFLRHKDHEVKKHQKEGE